MSLHMDIIIRISSVIAIAYYKMSFTIF
uniref:Uncharacterized protein n=1 Tax=Rhizophora mucronata TaxID=61149 RepID=A0A2P2QD30_RHIMU